jgi:hypothetical protein
VILPSDDDSVYLQTDTVSFWDIPRQINTAQNLTSSEFNETRVTYCNPLEKECVQTSITLLNYFILGYSMSNEHSSKPHLL